MMRSLPNRLNDDDPMPIGTFKGERLGDVPDWWLRWFLEQDWCDLYPLLVNYANVLIDDEV